MVQGVPELRYIRIKMRGGPHTSSSPAKVTTTTIMKTFACFLVLAVLVAVASAGYLSSGWSSPSYSGYYSRPAYSRISYAPSYGSYGGYGGYGGYSGYSGYGGYSGGRGWNSGWW